MNSSCEKLVQQYVKVNADVTVTPLFEHGEPTVTCVKSEVTPCSPHESKECESSCCEEVCQFRVSQVLCIEIPLCFGVDVDVEKGSISCGKPEVGQGNCKCKQ